jgi:hypothetical protein
MSVIPWQQTVSIYLFGLSLHLGLPWGGTVSNHISFLTSISGPIDNSSYTEIKECTMREQALFPWGPFARKMFSLFHARLGKVQVQLICGVILLSGIEAQKF